MRLASEGFLDKEIAAKFGISLTTVRTYWNRIRAKLEASNKAHAIALGMPHNHVEKAAGELMAFLVHAIDDEAIFLCSHDQKLLTWNKGVGQLFGYSEGEWIGQDVSLFFVPDEKQDASTELSDANEAGLSVNYRWHMRKDGSRFWGSNTVLLLDHAAGEGTYAKIVRLKEDETG